MRKIEPKTMTKTERLHWGYGVDAIKKMEYELMGYLHEYKALPPAGTRFGRTTTAATPNAPA
jgi:hypothetical protein